MENKQERQDEFKNRLALALELRGVRAIDLSDKTGIPKGAISYYLAGKSQPKADRLYKISTALGVSEAWLLGYNVPMDRSASQKKNDHLAQVVVKLRSDNDFYDDVMMLDSLQPADRAAVHQLLLALNNK